MRKILFIVIVAAVSISLSPQSLMAASDNSVKTSVSTKKERNAITEGNALYNQSRFVPALKKYEEALKDNPNSAVARYNLGLTEIMMTSQAKDSVQAKELMRKGSSSLQQVARMGRDKPQLAAKANYNLGNISFLTEDYSSALGYYKEALRLNPEDNAARRNLRITQLKLQNQQNQQNQDQQKEDQDQQDNQDKNQEQQNQDQQQDNQEQNQDNNQDQQQQNQQPDINEQTAEQILKAMENKENNTRARVAAGQQGDKSKGRPRNPRNW